MGRAVMQKFLQEGWHITGTLIPGETLSTGYGDKQLLTVEADLLDEEGARRLVEGMVLRQGTIDAAVLTVGGFAMGSVAETPASGIHKQIQLNFDTAYHVARPVFMQMMKQGRGRIFLVGSRPGLSMQNSKGMTAYGLAKSLIFRLAELLNEEAKGTDVVTVVIVPSTIDTPQNRAAMPDADFSKWVKPEAIADAIYYYASEEAGEIREAVVKVYGGS